MTDRSTGPRCGNNPNTRLTPGDRKAVDDAKARLALLADARPYIDRAVWVDGDPLMEVIASTVWKHCGRDSEEMPQLVCDDPRTIAAFAAAVARAHAASPAPATDQAALRDRIADLLAASDGWKWAPGFKSTSPTWQGYQERAAAVLAVLPAPADRAAVLREAAEVLGRMDYDADSNDYGYDTYRDAWNGGVMDGADLLRRMADETQQPETEAAAAPEPRHTCHDQKSAPGRDWECQWCSTLPDDIGPATSTAQQDGAQS